jgi:hypothetical protein
VHKQEDDMIRKCCVFGFNLMRLLNKVDDGASAGTLEKKEAILNKYPPDYDSLLAWGRGDSA